MNENKTLEEEIKDLIIEKSIKRYDKKHKTILCVFSGKQRIDLVNSFLSLVVARLEKEKIYKEKLYHYICHGGSCVGPHIDKWGKEEIYICNSAQPDGGWINAPNCRNCDGKVFGRLEESLSEKDKWRNQAIADCIHAIRGGNNDTK